MVEETGKYDKIINQVAGMAKLADALGLGPSGRKAVGVQIPLSAQTHPGFIKVSYEPFIKHTILMGFLLTASAVYS